MTTESTWHLRSELASGLGGLVVILAGDSFQRCSLRQKNGLKVEKNIKNWVYIIVLYFYVDQKSIYDSKMKISHCLRRRRAAGSVRARPRTFLEHFLKLKLSLKEYTHPSCSTVACNFFLRGTNCESSEVYKLCRARTWLHDNDADNVKIFIFASYIILWSTTKSK